MKKVGREKFVVIDGFQFTQSYIPSGRENARKARKMYEGEAYKNWMQTLALAEQQLLQMKETE